ncbi:MAG TPA: hypothetical protein VHZ25_15545 [Acidobacteriaceae bacterium]|nr:hypothetical protein [Acidobacteriaceae bacterium]
MNEPVSPSVRRRRHHPLVLALLWTTSILIILAIAAIVAGNIYLHRAGPLLKAKVVETLSTRFDSRVELDQFHASFIDGFQVSGSGLKLYPNHLDGNEPMIAIDRFSFHIFDWHQLLHTPIVVNRVQVTGLNIHLPPKDQRANMPHLEQSQKPGEDQSHGKIQILVREIDVDRADLLIENGKPGKVPLDFVISKIQLHSVAAGRPMRFHAILVNPRPTGNIDSTGDFGPFNEHSPGDTPVDGRYTFRNADLNTIKGLGGMLSSDGSYKGQLNHIEVDGTTTTPNFSLDIANRPVPLNTTFHAIVDGTNGDTYLQPVDAWLLHTHIIARGDVVHVAGVQGRDIRLSIIVDPGHIEDMLNLSVKAAQPLMTGQIQVHAKFDLPPGPASVTDKIRLQGNFDLSDAHFTNDQIQSRVDELSLRGQGKAQQANDEGKAMKDQKQAKGQTPPQNSAAPSNASDQALAPPTADIGSEMRGNFTFGDSQCTISALNFLVPGAAINLQGAYGLKGETLDFTGTARLDAHLSQMVTGWKSLLLKPVDPFFAKNGAGTFVPIKIGGTASHPAIGLDFKHKDKDKDQKTPTPAPANSTGR